MRRGVERVAASRRADARARLPGGSDHTPIRVGRDRIAELAFGAGANPRAGVSLLPSPGALVMERWALRARLGAHPDDRARASNQGGGRSAGTSLARLTTGERDETGADFDVYERCRQLCEARSVGV